MSAKDSPEESKKWSEETTLERWYRDFGTRPAPTPDLGELPSGGDRRGAAGGLLPRASGASSHPEAGSRSGAGARTGVVKGAVSFDEGAVLYLFTKRSDATTLLHESAHLFRRTLSGADAAIATRHFGDLDTTMGNPGPFSEALKDPAEGGGVFPPP